jgi:glycosyltransferase involved in cell wall biosynthesis
LDIVDLVDEIIIVDNGSTDGTLKMVNDLEMMYDNVYVYQYNIQIPRYGMEHAKNFMGTTMNNKHNTLKNYYNWTESKATYDKKIKWDGDFYCIRHNFKKMLNYFKNHTDPMAVHFSGLTLFIHQDKQYIKSESYYNEYRMFLNDKTIWEDNFTSCGKNYGESSLYFSKQAKEKYFINYPIFIEIKLTTKDEFIDSRSNLIDDARDSVDFRILKDLKNNFTNNFELVNNVLYEIPNYIMKSSNYEMIYSEDEILSYANYVAKFNPIWFSDRIHKFYKRKTILLIIDSHGWAFDNISKQIKKYNQEYNITICTYPELYAKICHNYTQSYWRKSYNYAIIDLNKQYDKILFFWYGDENTKILDFFVNKKISNVYLCMYDYSLWVNNPNTLSEQTHKKCLENFLNHISGILYASPHILDTLQRLYPDFNKTKFKCYDGVDAELFKYAPYDADVYTKPKLTIGWIGNSNPSAHGINKGYELIKRTVESMNNIFTFMPQDSYTGTKICHTDIPNYLAKVDIIICFSKAEGTPNQILEASSSGRCWISTDVGIVSELNNNKYGSAGIVINRSEHNLKRALLKLYNNRNIIVDYGKNGRKAIEDTWQWKQKVKQFYAFFDSTD